MLLPEETGTESRSARTVFSILPCEYESPFEAFSLELGVSPGLEVN